MMHRFITFIEQIRKSTKNASKHLLESILLDARSTTGSNIRNILLLTDKSLIQELVPNDVLALKYNRIENEEKWKIIMAQEIIEIKNGNLEVDNFRREELEEMLEFFVYLVM